MPERSEGCVHPLAFRGAVWLIAESGRPLALDLCSVLMLPSLTRRWSFISQALGLMVDLDIGTENLRWMGDTRFVLGFLKGVVSNRNFKARIRMNVVEADKVEMAREARERSHVALTPVGTGTDPLNPGKNARQSLRTGPDDRDHGFTNGHDAEASEPEPHEAEEVTGGMPEAKPLVPTDQWLTIDSGTKSTEPVTPEGAPNSILYFYAGIMPWVSRDLNQWPVATVGQGMVDVAIQRVVRDGTDGFVASVCANLLQVPRATMVNAINGAENGETFWLESQHYWKAKSYVVENLDPKNQKTFTIGESGSYEQGTRN